MPTVNRTGLTFAIVVALPIVLAVDPPPCDSSIESVFEQSDYITCSLHGYVYETFSNPIDLYTTIFATTWPFCSNATCRRFLASLANVVKTDCIYLGASVMTFLTETQNKCQSVTIASGGTTSTPAPTTTESTQDPSLGTGHAISPSTQGAAIMGGIAAVALVVVVIVYVLSRQQRKKDSIAIESNGVGYNVCV